MTAEVSTLARETARKGIAFLFQRLQSVGQANVAEAMRVSEATVSRLKNDYAEQLVLLAAICGAKLVPIDARCYLPADIEPLLNLAKQRMDQITTIDQLRWEE